jgi:flagellar basal body-associated protein FliL
VNLATAVLILIILIVVAFAAFVLGAAWAFAENDEREEEIDEYRP